MVKEHEVTAKANIKGFMECSFTIIKELLCAVARRVLPWYHPPHRPGTLPGGQVCDDIVPVFFREAIPSSFGRSLVTIN
jgi:hypothetical protein